MATQGDQLGLAIKNPLKFKVEAIKHFEVQDNKDHSRRLLSIYKCKKNQNTRRFKFKIYIF